MKETKKRAVRNETPEPSAATFVSSSTASASIASPPKEPYYPLPPLTGPDRIVLMMVHPQILFLHWKIGQMDGPAELRLEISGDGVSYEEVDRKPIDLTAPNWYLRNSYVDCYARVRVGHLCSNTIVIPRAKAGREPERWMSLADLQKAAWESPRRHPSKARLTLHRSRVWRYPDYDFVPHESAKPLPPPRILSDSAYVRGSLMLVLHAHLPFVRHPEHRFFLEEQWLFEAITETYLPILEMLERFTSEKVNAAFTMSITPTLMSMLRDPLLLDKYAEHLDRMCELAHLESERTRGEAEFLSVVTFYRERLERYRQRMHDPVRRDLVGAFARMEEAGHLELITCAATHGFLPHLQENRAAVWAQIITGVREHTRQIGRAPRGIWLPECAYFEGLDEMLARAGIEYFFVDTHALEQASSAPKMGPYAPIFTPAGVAAFGRDVESSVEVWSSKQGYPGDFAYRDFYRDIGFDLPSDYISPFLDPAGTAHMTGFKYYRITGKSDHKEPYKRIWAEKASESHAGDFTAKRAAQMTRIAPGMMRKPNIVSMYDAELFGHWWFEGPEWIEAVFRNLSAAGIRAMTPGRYLEENPVGQVAEPAASSWGNKGYYEVWLGKTNDWLYPPLHDAGRRMRELAQRYEHPDAFQKRLLNQAARELLLAQSSDWPFILSTGTSTGYARRRIGEHLDRFDRLAQSLEGKANVTSETLQTWEATDNLFPEIDYRTWCDG